MMNTDFWKGKKVFLTGHTGFKGSWLSIWLHQLGANVCGYALEPNTNPSLFKLANIDNLVKSHIGDIRDLEHLKKSMQEFQPDIIMHMAAQPLVRESYENPVDTYATNVMGTVNVLESARFCKSVKAILNITTDKVYENKEWAWGYREIDRLGGYDPYSNSKACSELVTNSYINSFFNPDKFQEHGVAIATARAGNVIGGGDWSKDRLVPDILKSIENNEDIILRNPNAIRPWQHVLEPLSGYLMLVEKLFSEGITWNGSWNFGPHTTNMQTVEYIASQLKMLLGNESDLIINASTTSLHETQTLKLDSSKANFNLKWQCKMDVNMTLEYVSEWHEKYSIDSALLMCLKQINRYSEV